MAINIGFAKLSALGAKGLLKDGAAAREAAVRKAIEATGAKVLGLYWTSGRYDMIVISEGGDETGGMAIQLAAKAAGVSADFDVMVAHTSAQTDAILKYASHYAPPNV